MKLEELKEEYKYCECIEYIPEIDSIGNLVRYKVHCDIYDFDITHKDKYCSNCRFCKQ